MISINRNTSNVLLREKVNQAMPNQQNIDPVKEFLSELENAHKEILRSNSSINTVRNIMDDLAVTLRSYRDDFDIDVPETLELIEDIHSFAEVGTQLDYSFEIDCIMDLFKEESSISE